MITQTYKLDIVPNGIKQVVDIHESDAGIRQITFQLYSSQGTSITLPVGAVAYVEGKKFSGAAYSYSATLSGTNVTFTVTPQMAAEEGGHDAQIKIMKDEDIICAANFTFWVQRDVLDGADMSDTEVPGLVTQMETMVDAAEGYAEQAAASASSMTPIDDELDEDSTNPVQNKVITEAFESGVFEGMTVGNAEQLVTSQKVSDSVPYVFRTTGGSADVGNRETDEIVGGSVVWGQMIYDGNFATGDGWLGASGTTVSESNNTLTVTGTTTAYLTIYTDTNHRFKSIPGHKYLISLVVASNSGRFTLVPTAVSTDSILYISGATSDTSVNWIWACNVDKKLSMNVRCGVTTSGTSEAVTATIKNYQLFDLTAMFGSSIADYLYTLESGTAGAGVAKLKEWGFLTKSYYSYSANKIESVNVSTHVLTGFNQWDEEWELGVYSTSDGSAVTNNNRIRSKNRIHVIPNTTYYCKSGTTGITINLCFYDGSGAFISSMTGKQNATFTTPSNACYMNFNTASVNLSTYNNDICINLHHSGRRDGEYEAYVKREYPLDSSITLRGIPKLDANNNLYFDGDVYKSDGSVDAYYVQTTLNGASGETWTKSSVSNPYYVHTVGDKGSVVDHMLLSDSFVATTITGSNTNVGIDVLNSNGYNAACIFIRMDDMTADADAFKTWLSTHPVTVIYKKVTPTTSSATSYQNPQICDDWGTEEYVDYSYTQGTRDFAMPTGHSTEYPTNMVDKLNHLPSAASANGDYIIRQNGMQMSLIPNPLPDAPTTNGTYVLKCTVSSGSASYSWVSE